MEQVQELLKVMMEDCQKWDAEIAEERRCREEEFVAERKRAKEESLRREQEMQERMDAIQAHMESLMKLVETSMRKEAEGAKCQTGSTNGER